MSNTITHSTKILKSIFPTGSISIINGLIAGLQKYGYKYGVLNSNRRLAAFIAQCGHETAGFKTLEEYASGAAYEGRKDLGNVIKGDGIKFKGRGYIQTTGRTNYKRASMLIFGDDRLLNNPKLLLVPEYAIQAAFIYWNDKQINVTADKGDTLTVSRKINGFVTVPNGLQDRIKKTDSTLIALNNNPAFVADLKKKYSEDLSLYYLFDRIGKIIKW